MAYGSIMAMHDAAFTGAPDVPTAPAPVLRAQSYVERNLAANLGVARLAAAQAALAVKVGD